MDPIKTWGYLIAILVYWRISLDIQVFIPPEVFTVFFLVCFFGIQSYRTSGLVVALDVYRV